MKLTFRWGHEDRQVVVPERWKIVIPQPEEVADPASEAAVLDQAFAAPHGASPLSGRDLSGKRVLIVTDDNTRPTPVARFFGRLMDALTQAGARTEDITVITALGIHTAMTDAEVAEKIGARYAASLRWINHDAFDDEANVAVGTTSRGTPVWLNKVVLDADLIISLGLIEPHLWAGYGGGMKNISPGIASADTIGAHHGLIARPPFAFNRVGMPPEDNDFRLDLEEVQGMLAAEVFVINVTLAPDGQIVGAFTGDPVAANRAGVAFNRRRSGLKLDRRVDGVIVNAHPMDLNFKQSMKGVANALPALRRGGIVMGMLRAERGLDDIPLPDKATPLWLTKRLLRTLGPKRVMWFLERVRRGQNVEEKFLTYYSMQLVRAHDLYFHVPSLSAHEVKQLGFFEACESPQDVIDQGVMRLGYNARVAFFPEAGATFPVL